MINATFLKIKHSNTHVESEISQLNFGNVIAVEYKKFRTSGLVEVCVFKL